MGRGWHWVSFFVIVFSLSIGLKTYRFHSWPQKAFEVSWQGEVGGRREKPNVWWLQLKWNWKMAMPTGRQREVQSEREKPTYSHFELCFIKGNFARFSFHFRCKIIARCGIVLYWYREFTNHEREVNLLPPWLRLPPSYYVAWAEIRTIDFLSKGNGENDSQSNKMNNQNGSDKKGEERCIKQGRRLR